MNAGDCVELRNWGRGFCVVVEDPQGDAIDVDRTDSFDDPHFCRVLAVCTSRDSAEAAARLLGGLCTAGRRR